MIRTLLIIAAAGIVLSVVTLGGAAVLAGPEVRNGWYIDTSNWGDDHDGVRHDGPQIERTLTWTGGDALTVSAPVDVIFAQGDEASVRASGPQAVVDRLTLVDGRLDLEGERDGVVFGWTDSDHVRVYVTAPGVSRFSVHGSGDMDLRNIDVVDLIIEIMGSGDVEANGVAQTLAATVRGSGDADLDGITAQRATLSIDGSGEISANPVLAAEVQINGSGDVRLTTRPADLNEVVRGSGDVRIGGDD